MITTSIILSKVIRICSQLIMNFIKFDFRKVKKSKFKCRYEVDSNFSLKSSKSTKEIIEDFTK